MKKILFILMMIFISISMQSQERKDVILKQTTIFMPSEGTFLGATLYLNGQIAEMSTGVRVSFITIKGPGRLILREGCQVFVRDDFAMDVEVEVLPMRKVARDTINFQRGEPRD